MHPPKIAPKCRFPGDKNLMCNFNSGNGLSDPKSVSQDMKLILKVFEINKIWVKPFFFRPPSSLQPRNSFLVRTVSFFGGFFKERYQIAQEDPLLQTRHVPTCNVSETSPLYSPPLLLNRVQKRWHHKKTFFFFFFFFCISAFWITCFGGAWWNTSTAQIWFESVYGGPRYGQCKLAWFQTVTNQANFTPISTGLIRYSCGHILGHHEPIHDKFGVWGFFIMFYWNMVMKMLKCKNKKTKQNKTKQNKQTNKQKRKKIWWRHTSVRDFQFTHTTLRIIGKVGLLSAHLPWSEALERGEADE